MDDLISRRAAIKAVESAMQNYTSSSIAIYAARDNIILLPPARPNLDEWCTDCQEYDSEKHCCPRWNRVIRQTLKDAQPELIRCRDCKFQDKGLNESESWNLCGYRPWLHVPTEDEHYCGYAKRRTEE